MATNISGSYISSTFQRLLLRASGQNIGAGANTVRIEIQDTSDQSQNTELYISRQRVGIGKSDPDSLLHVVGTATINDIVLSGSSIATSGTNTDLTLSPAGTGSVVISKADINAGSIDGVTIGTNSPATNIVGTEATIGETVLTGNYIRNSSGSDIEIQYPDGGSHTTALKVKNDGTGTYLDTILFNDNNITGTSAGVNIIDAPASGNVLAVSTSNIFLKHSGGIYLNDDLYLNGNGGTSSTLKDGANAGDIIVNTGISTDHIFQLNQKTTIKTDGAVSGSGGTGWSISGAGAGDFRYLYADELHVTAFIADLEQALAGGQTITKSVAILSSDMTIPDYGVTTATLQVDNIPSMGTSAVFQDDDWVRLRTISRSGGGLTVGDAWGKVEYKQDNGDGTQQYYFERGPSANSAGGTLATSTTIAKGTLVLDYGTSGDGYYNVSAVDGYDGANAPYAQVKHWSGSNGPGETGALKTNVRMGKLTGITSNSDEWGIMGGTAFTDNDPYFKFSNLGARFNNIPLRMFVTNNEVARIDPGGLVLQNNDIQGPSIALGKDVVGGSLSAGDQGFFIDSYKDMGGGGGSSYEMSLFIGTKGGKSIEYDSKLDSLTVKGTLQVLNSGGTGYEVATGASSETYSNLADLTTAIGTTYDNTETILEAGVTIDGGGIYIADDGTSSSNARLTIAPDQTLVNYADQGDIFLGNVAGVPKFSCVNADGSQYIKWNGSSLQISGSIEVQGTIDHTNVDGLDDNYASETELGTTNSNVDDIIDGTTDIDLSNNTSTNANWNNPQTYNFGANGLTLGSIPTPTVAGLYLGNSHLGFHDGNDWKTFMGNDGSFYLGGSGAGTSGTGLSWNSGTLTIRGTVLNTSGVEYGEGISYAGVWVSGTTYKKNDAVTHTINGIAKTFISNQDNNTGNTPTNGSSSDPWSILLDASGSYPPGQRTLTYSSMSTDADTTLTSKWSLFTNFTSSGASYSDNNIIYQDFSTASGMRLGNDPDSDSSTDDYSYLNYLEAGDHFTMVVSNSQWYYFKIKSVSTQGNWYNYSCKNLEIELVQEEITAGEHDFSASDTPVSFVFYKSPIEQPLTWTPNTYGMRQVSIYSKPGQFIKTGGGSQWTSSVHSSEGYKSAHLIFKHLDGTTSGNYAIGLEAAPGNTSTYTDLDYYWHFTSGTSAVAKTGPTSLHSVSGVSANDIFEIVYDGLTIKWYLNGVEKHTESADVENQTLYLDSAAYTLSYDPAFEVISYGPTGQSIPGTTGANGVGISSTVDNGNGTFTINYTDGTFFTSADLTGPSGGGGASVDIIFKRASSQPTAPSQTTSTPSGWYSDVASVPAGSNPMYSSVGQRPANASNYVWNTPIKIEGQEGVDGDTPPVFAEVTIYRRSAGNLTASPSGGVYDFSSNSMTTLPTYWSALPPAPSGTDALWISKAVASAPTSSGTDNTLAWSAPIKFLEQPVDGTNGSSAYQLYLDGGGTLSQADWLASLEGSAGSDGIRGSLHIYITTSQTQWNMTTVAESLAALAATASDGVARWRDVVTISNSSVGFSATFMVGSNTATMSAVQQVIDGSLIVSDTITGAKIDGNELSAIFADLGDITAGTLRKTGVADPGDGGQTTSGIYMKVDSGYMAGPKWSISSTGDVSVDDINLNGVITLTESNANVSITNNGSVGGNKNVFIGYDAGLGSQTSQGNIAIGRNAGKQNEDSSGTTWGEDLVGSTQSIYIGSGATPSDVSVKGEIVIGGTSAGGFPAIGMGEYTGYIEVDHLFIGRHPNDTVSGLARYGFRGTAANQASYFGYSAGGAKLEMVCEGTKLLEYHTTKLEVYQELHALDNAIVSGNVLCYGDVIAYYSSDRRLKTDIEIIKDPLKKIDALSGVTFNWNSNSDKPLDTREAGVIAQDVEAVLPEVVTTRKDGMKAVQYDKIIPLLIEGIKELKKTSHPKVDYQSEIDSLKEEIKELKGMIKNG